MGGRLSVTGGGFEEAWVAADAETRGAGLRL